MKINYKLNDKNQIIGWSSLPLFDNLPMIDIDEPESIILNFDMIVDGVYISKREEFEAAKEKNQYVEDINQRIEQLKVNLQETDYHLYKFVEGYYTAEEYEPYKLQRQEWRNEINKLEGLLSNM